MKCNVKRLSLANGKSAKIQAKDKVRLKATEKWHQAMEHEGYYSTESSRFTGYFIKRKNEAFQQFLKFKAKIETHTEKRIQSLQSDNGILNRKYEYIKQEFEEYLNKCGINKDVLQLHIAQNKMESARGKLHVDRDGKVPTHAGESIFMFLGRGSITANYIRNRCPVWEAKCRLSDEVKRYKIWLPECKRMEITRNVKFLMPKYHGTNNFQNTFPEDQNIENKAGDSYNTTYDDEVIKNNPVDLRMRTRTGQGQDEDKNNSDNESHEENASKETPKRGRGSPQKKTWELVQRPKNVIGSRFVLSMKRNHNREFKKNKARLVTKGYAQQPDIDFNEIFSPVTRMNLIRMMVSLVSKYMFIEQIDIAAYLNSTLEEDIFVEIPQHFEKDLEFLIKIEPKNSEIRKMDIKILNY
ncbi:uncharacterized protein LOC112553104 [Pogonomyrmex barbatus]|uniref:Uncharacterized protein LOC112553104 n=1 Tax=Pogonomyrmex barbatus TaxID=144034 RepID=A0A8N1SCD2_9HYME|nr:uncharacterized protein LOC112553104 [Pogonomyrmex barbatus]